MMYNYANESLERLRSKERQLESQADELRAAVDTLRDNVQTVPLEKRRNEARLLEEDRRLKDEKLSVDKRLNHVRSVIQSTSDTMHRFEDLLGVKLRATDDKCIEFSFICIDEEDPFAEFKVTVASRDGSFRGKLSPRNAASMRGTVF